MQQTRHRFVWTPLLAAGVILTTGCAFQPQPEETVVQTMPTLTTDPAHAEVTWVEFDQHAVVARVDGYRHVITDGPQWWHDGDLKTSTTNTAVTDASHALDRDEDDQARKSREAMAYPLAAREGTIEVDSAPSPGWSSNEMNAWRELCMNLPLNEEQRDLLRNMEPPKNKSLTCRALHRVSAIQGKE